jgi:hypothetical protein
MPEAEGEVRTGAEHSAKGSVEIIDNKDQGVAEKSEPAAATEGSMLGESAAGWTFKAQSWVVDPQVQNSSALRLQLYCVVNHL